MFHFHVFVVEYSSSLVGTPITGNENYLQHIANYFGVNYQTLTGDKVSSRPIGVWPITRIVATSRPSNPSRTFAQSSPGLNTVGIYNRRISQKIAKSIA